MYNNLIRHFKNLDILYKLLRLLEDWEQIITDRNTKTNYQITNTADQPLTVMWIAKHLPVNATNFLKNFLLQRVSEVMPWSGGKTRQQFLEIDWIDGFLLNVSQNRHN